MAPPQTKIVEWLESLILEDTTPSLLTIETKPLIRLLPSSPFLR